VGSAETRDLESFTFLSLSTRDIVVVIVSTVNHGELLAAHEESTAHLFRVFTVTEHDVRDCVYCGNVAGDHFLGDTPFSETFFLIPERLKNANDGHFPVPNRFQHRSIDWYCAQQRNLKGVSAALAALSPDALPEWLLLQDDDTFINPVATLALLAYYERTTPVALGDKWGGGAGFFFNKAALQRLMKPSPMLRLVWMDADSRWSASGNYSFIDVCVMRQMGGSWCYMHSDHAIADCLDSLGIELLNLGHENMLQECPVGPTHRGGADPARWKHAARTRLAYTYASCHRVDAATIRGMYGLLRDTISVLNGTTADASLSKFVVPPATGVNCAAGRDLGIAHGVSAAACANYCLVDDTCSGFTHTSGRYGSNCYWKAVTRASHSTPSHVGCEASPNATWYARRP
jgi:hypothetical protein